MNKIQLSKEWWIALAIIIGTCLLVSFSFGYWRGMVDIKDNIPCPHQEPYEIKTSIDTIMLLVPDGWSSVPLLNEHNKVYRKPSDQRE